MSDEQKQDQKLIEGRDYYFLPNGLMVFTAEFLLRRGYCCGSGCKHCPYPKSSYAQLHRNLRSDK